VIGGLGTANRRCLASDSGTDVVGRPGRPNRWEIPKDLHKSLHPEYNKRFIAEVKKLEGNYSEKEILDIRDRLAIEFGIEKYRP
jgi:hypothetical protein